MFSPFSSSQPSQLLELLNFAELSQIPLFTSTIFLTIEMDFHDLNAPPYVEQSVFPFADLQCDEASVDWPSSEFAAPIDFSSNVDGRYKMNNASFFDTEYIDPALLEAQNPAAMNDALNDYDSPTMQNTQNGLSAFHPEWHNLATDFEEQQHNFQSRQGVHDGAFPNALDTSPHDGTSFDWPGAWQGEQGGLDSLASLDHIADKPAGRLDPFRVRFFFRLTLKGRSENSGNLNITHSGTDAL